MHAQAQRDCFASLAMTRDPMKLSITRLDRDGRYETLVTRDDGVTFRLHGVAHAFAIPHDLAHYVVEMVLGLDGGFWASIADGAVFPSMTHVGGRRKPKAAERSKTILKANARPLSEAEVLVGIFTDTIEEGHGETSPALHGRLKELKGRWIPPGQHPRDIPPARIAEVFAAYRDMLARWKSVPVGGTLDLSWSS
jgi:hypothetical protein